MSELNFLENISNNNDLSNILNQAGDSIVKNVQDLFKQDPSKVLDVLNQMGSGSQSLPEGFPAADQFFSNTSGGVDQFAQTFNNLAGSLDGTAGQQSNGGIVGEILKTVEGVLGGGTDGNAGGLGSLLGSGQGLGSIASLAGEILPEAALLI